MSGDDRVPLVLPVIAQEEKQIVRVGWYESPFNYTDQFGRRSGYAYEFQQKIAAYTGWEYEYVEGSWPELLQMLIDGELDLLSDVSFTQERTGQMLFPTLPMGTEEYYLFVSGMNEEFNPDSYQWFNGKRIGVNKGSLQASLLREWLDSNSICADVIEVSCTEDESIQMLDRRELDAFVSLDSYNSHITALPVVKVGSSDFYFAINYARTDLLAELNDALSRIQDENRYYSQQLYMDYLTVFAANLFLTAEEREWLSHHGTIRVGYQDNYLSFCDKDENGHLAGALKDYLGYAADCLENVHLDFAPVAFPTAAAALQALQQGEVDCVFPVTLCTADGENMGVLMTPSVMSAELYALVRKAEKADFAGQEQITTAVEEGNPNYSTMVMNCFPDWTTEGYGDITACMQAVAQGKSDCVLVSNYNYNSLARSCEKLNLTPLSTGKTVDLYFAVRRSDRELYTILTRTTGIVNDAAISSALSYYSSQEAKTSLLDLIVDHPAAAVAAVVVILSMLLVIFAQRRIIRAEREVMEREQQVEDLSQRVYVDPLTRVRNKAAFLENTEEIQRQLDQGEKPAFAIAVFDCDNLKKINDQYGHEKGDIYIKAASQLICRTFQHSPVFRIGGDEFTAVLTGEDYDTRAALTEQLNRALATQEDGSEPWTQARLSMGLAAYDTQVDSTVTDTIRRADADMYETKKARKALREH